MKMIATTEMIVSIAVHVARVCGTVMSKYSFTSQNPPSLTCDAISDPELFRDLLTADLRGEDVAEVQCHGSAAVISRIIDRCLECGLASSDRQRHCRYGSRENLQP